MLAGSVYLKYKKPAKFLCGMTFTCRLRSRYFLAGVCLPKKYDRRGWSPSQQEVRRLLIIEAK